MTLAWPASRVTLLCLVLKDFRARGEDKSGAGNEGLAEDTVLRSSAVACAM